MGSEMSIRERGGEIRRRIGDGPDWTDYGHMAEEEERAREARPEDGTET